MNRRSAAGAGVSPYCVGDAASLRRAGKYLIVDVCGETQGDEGWVEDHGWMSSLAGVCEQLLGGDVRPLFLAWLLSVQSGEVDDDDLEPAVPPGLG